MTHAFFLAVPLSDADKHAMAAALSEASPGPKVPGRRVPAENWHITLRFLGEAEQILIDRLLYEAGESIDVPPSDIYCRKLGAFPAPTKAGIVYVDVEDPTGSLDACASQCEEAAREAGFEPDERPFVPHITISRLRPKRDVSTLLSTFSDFRIRLPVDRVVLYRSERRADGMNYVPVDSLVLG